MFSKMNVTNLINIMEKKYICVCISINNSFYLFMFVMAEYFKNGQDYVVGIKP